MKKQLIVSIIFLMLSLTLNAQISLSHSPNIDITGSNVFLDATTLFSSAAGAPNSTGKGIVVPSVDLVNFEFDLTLADGITFPTYFDGMLVYNNATNNTLTTGNRSSTPTAVTPGFYYFSNPNGAVNSNVTSGIWTPLGNNAAKNINALNEVATSISVDGAIIFAIKGTFTVVAYDPVTKLGGATVTIVPPSGISAVYRITIFKGSSTLVFSPSVNSYDFSIPTNNVITGDGMFTQVYPAGTYNYTLEYFK